MGLSDQRLRRVYWLTIQNKFH